MAHFKELIVWQKSVDLAEFVYLTTNNMPQHQKYSLADQMQRASVSVMSNIAEGSKRSRKEWINFLRMAHGSTAELESQFILALRLNYITKEQFEAFNQKISHITRILNSLIYSNKTSQ